MPTTATTLFDIPAYTVRQTAEIAAVLLDKADRLGWDELPVDEKVELRLLRTLLDGWADPQQ